MVRWSRLIEYGCFALIVCCLQRQGAFPPDICYVMLLWMRFMSTNQPYIALVGMVLYHIIAGQLHSTPLVERHPLPHTSAQFAYWERILYCINFYQCFGDCEYSTRLPTNFPPLLIFVWSSRLLAGPRLFVRTHYTISKDTLLYNYCQ